MSNFKKIKALGLMSGTSVDGLDIAYCEFSFSKNKWNYKVIDAKTFNYTKALKQDLRNAENLSSVDLYLLSNFIAKHFAGKVNLFLKGKSKPDVLCSHGHTVFHQPKSNLTVQIGNGAILACETGIKTICDFRTSDVAAGGQGAPLVPIGDKLLFSEYDYCVNIGGFANVSSKKSHHAFDICGVNLVLNYLCSKLNKEFDKNGDIAKSGVVNIDLFKKLNALNYYKKSAPKSLGKEWLIENVYPIINNSNLKIQDIITTYTEHCAYQISKVLNSSNKQKALFTGGGAKNTHLISRIKHYTTTQIIVPEMEVVDFKEAIIFAFLGVLRLLEKPNSLASVTGAKKNTIGGAIYCA